MAPKFEVVKIFNYFGIIFRKTGNFKLAKEKNKNV